MTDLITVSQAVMWNIPCPGTPTVTDVEGNVYNTVQIGNQCWMKENLRTKKYRYTGDILEGTHLGEISEASTNKYYFLYNNNENLIRTYGYLYNWYAAINSDDSNTVVEADDEIQGICPDGWHLPNSGDFGDLGEFVRDYLYDHFPDADFSVQFQYFKEAGTEHWDTGNDGNNISGFSALPGGYRNIYGEYMHLGSQAQFWASRSYENNYADGIYLLLNNQWPGWNEKSRRNEGKSIRCIKD